MPLLAVSLSLFWSHVRLLIVCFSDGNFDINENGISLQAMDSSHVSLVALLLRADGFDHFRADKNLAVSKNKAGKKKS